MAKVERRSRLTCPHCGHQADETMPEDHCLYFYDCAGCGRQLKPKAGDCCVFCSYGTLPCPPIQIARRADGEKDPSSGCQSP